MQSARRCTLTLELPGATTCSDNSRGQHATSPRSANTTPTASPRTSTALQADADGTAKSPAFILRRHAAIARRHAVILESFAWLKWIERTIVEIAGPADPAELNDIPRNRDRQIDAVVAPADDGILRWQLFDACGIDAEFRLPTPTIAVVPIQPQRRRHRTGRPRQMQIVALAA